MPQSPPVTRATSNVRRAEARDRVAREYPSIATELLGPLIDLISLSRLHCAGDIDKFLILLVVAVRSTEHPRFRTFSPEQLLSGEIPVFPGLGTNVRSIAASVGVPRETVRRKVGELVASGWLVRQGRSLYFTAGAYQALAPVREALERAAVSYFATVSELMARPPE